MAAYTVVRNQTQLAVRIFHKRLYINGKPSYGTHKTPIIYCSNHTNALTDPIAVGSFFYRLPIFLTRADVFKGKLALMIFKFFNMLPIYRQRDGVDTLKKNEATFRACIDNLQNQGALIIFPEANHHHEYRLRPLKKGLARIAFQAEEESNFQLDLQVAPVGLYYSDHPTFRGDLYIHYGPLISVSDFKETYEENPTRALVSISQRIDKQLKTQILHISNRTHYALINGLRKYFAPLRAQLKNKRYTLKDEFMEARSMVEELEAWVKQTPATLETVQTQLQRYETLIEETRVPSYIIRKGGSSWGNLIMRSVLLLLLSPIFFYGALHHILIYRIGHNVAVKNFKDYLFHSSIKMVIGMFGLPPYYLILALIVGLVSGDFLLALFYLASLPISGLLAMHYYDAFDLWRKQWKRKKLERAKNQAFIELLKVHTSLAKFCTEIKNTADQLVTK